MTHHAPPKPARRALLFLVALLGLSALACEPAASPIEGGGAGGGPAVGALTVFAIDEDSGAAVADATVTVDGMDVLTDGDGRAVFSHAGAADVSVRADGYLTERWLGIDAAELTVPLAPLAAPPIATGTVRARFDGFGALSPATSGNTARAILTATVSAALDDPANRSRPTVVCESPPDADCTFEGAVPVGTTALFAQLDEIDPSGVRVATLGFATSAAFEVTAGETVDVALDLIEPERLRALTVEPPPAPVGIDAVVGVPGLGVDGRVFLLAGDAGAVPFSLPAPTEPLAGTYWAVAIGASETATSRSVQRAAPGESPASLAPPALRSPPGAVRDGEGVVLDAVDDAAIVTLVAEGRWRVRRFDGRAVVEPPAGGLDGLDAVRVCATDVERAPDAWRLDAIERSWSRRACADVGL